MRRKIARGKPLTELVKGSYTYTIAVLEHAFLSQFDRVPETDWFWMVEVFVDFVIVKSEQLPPDEFYLVSYSWQDETTPVFAPRNEWEIVELAYRSAGMARPTEAQLEDLRREPHRFDEQARVVRVREGRGGERVISGVGTTVDTVNLNRRIYPRAVMDAALTEARERQSTLGGRAVLGEAEHPGDKATPRASFLETIIRWDSFVIQPDNRVAVEGAVIPTSRGQDAIILMDHGVLPGLSQRAWGYSEIETLEGQKVERITELHLDGWDLVLDPADRNGAVARLDSQATPLAPLVDSRRQPPTHSGGMTVNEDELTLEQLKQKYPDRFAQFERERDEARKAQLETEMRALAARDAALAEARRQAREEAEKEAAARESEAQKKLEEAQVRLRELEEAEQRRKVNEHIQKVVGAIEGYTPAMRQTLIEDVQADEPKTIEDADALIARRRKLLDAKASQETLTGQGYPARAAQGGARVQIVGPVIEQATGQPEFARVGFELTEALTRSGYRAPRPANARSLNERRTQEYLAKFDAQYRAYLTQEMRLWQDAETTTDLNLPYSVARTIMAEAVPQLIAISIFDYGMTDQAPARIYYEQYAAETGAAPTVTDEAVTASNPLGSYVALANRRLRPGTVVVTNSGATTTYTEGTDYVIDYGDGRFKALAGGTITAGQSLLIDYVYDAFRKGENAAIERGKTTLQYATLEIAADRLAAEITREAIVFSRSQLGWDAVTRTLNALIERIARKIDRDMFFEALAASLGVANNGGTWNSSSGTIAQLVAAIGAARVRVANRFYEPTFVLMSLTNADRLGNDSGTFFTAAGVRPDADLASTGYAGRVKGLPVFATTNFTDQYVVVGNRELVHHRVFQPMMIRGPYASYSSNKLVAADQYYAEEFNGTITVMPEKGSHVTIS